MIGPLEIVIIAFVLLLVFGGAVYKKLPQLGRSAGEGARKLGDSAMKKSGEAKQLAATTKEKHGDKVDPSALARQAGKGVREAREFKDSFTGAGTTSSAGETGKAAPKPAPAPAPEPTPEPQPADEPHPDPKAPPSSAS